MLSDVAAQVAALARRGQWHRCLDLLQQLTNTSSPAAPQLVLQHPAVLQGVLQSAAQHAQKVQADTAETVLLLCGHAMHSRMQPVPHTNLSALQRQEWQVLVTALLQHFKRSTVRQQSGSTSEFMVPISAATRAGTANASLCAAVVDVCAWARATQLGIDDVLLQEACAAAAGESYTGEVKAAAASTSPQQQQERGGCAREAESRSPRVQSPKSRSTTSRVARRITAAWRAATATLQSSAVNRTFRSDAELRAHFRQATTDLHSVDAAKDAAECVVSIYNTFATPPNTHFNPFLFCSLCEEVVAVLQGVAVAGSCTGTGAHGGGESDAARTLHESIVAVAAAELAVLQKSQDTLGDSTGGSLTASGATAECRMRTTRACGNVCSAVCALCGLATSTSQTRLKASEWLIEVLAALQLRLVGEQAVPPVVWLLNLIVSSAHTLPVVRGGVARSCFVGAAVRLVEAAMLAGARTPAAANDMLRLREALRLSEPKERCSGQVDPTRSSFSPQINAPAFASFGRAVLNGCKVETAAALLLGVVEPIQFGTAGVAQTLPVEERQRLVAALQVLSCDADKDSRQPALRRLACLSLILSALHVDAVVMLIVELVTTGASSPSSSHFRNGHEDYEAEREQAVAPLHLLLDHLPSDAARATAAQKALQVVRSTLSKTSAATVTESRRDHSTGAHASLLYYVLLMGGLVSSLLANPSVSCITTAAEMARCLETLTALLMRQGTLELCYALLHHVRVWIASDTHSFLRHHAFCCLLPSHAREKGDAEAAMDRPLRSAAECSAAWFEEQSTYLTANPPRNSPSFSSPNEKRQRQQHDEALHLCWSTRNKITRLCNVVAYAVLSLSPSAAGSSAARDIRQSVDAACAAVRHAIYEEDGTAHFFHCAVAACSPPSSPAYSPAASGSAAAVMPRASGVSALMQHHQLRPTSSSHGPFFRLGYSSTAVVRSRESTLSVQQKHIGTPLSAAHHDELVKALREFSQQRRVHDAMALFYAHERHNRRLTLAEVELFADTARRSAPAFLVRLLRYVPPPTESAVMASAVVMGAWRAYQRVLRQQKGGRGNPSTPSSLQGVPRAANKTASERAWWESMAIAAQAMELLPHSPAGASAVLNEPHRHALIFTVCRIVQARPTWLTSSASSAQLQTAVLASRFLSTSPLLAQRLQQGEVVRRSLAELHQTLAFCESHADAQTAVRAYLRFVRTHLPEDALIAKDRSAGVAALAVPLLSLPVYVSLLGLSSTYAGVAAAAEQEGWTAAVAAAAQRGDATNKPLQPPPAPPPSPLQQPATLKRHEEGEEEMSEMAKLLRLRAEMEGGEHKSREDNEVPVVMDHSPTDAAGTSTDAAQRRAQALQALAASAFHAVAEFLPPTLKRQVEAHMPLCPLTVVLHDALRWCQLRPQVWDTSTQAKSGAEVDDQEDEADAAPADENKAASGAEVLTRLLSAALHLDATVVCSTTDGVATAPFDGSSHLRGMGCTCCLFACRLPHEPASWALAQHSHALLEYVLRHLQALYAVEEGVMWVSPAQQQSAAVALLECLQVVLAAMEAVDAWAAAYRAQLVQERGGTWTSAAALPTAAEKDISAVATLRLKLRDAPLSLLQQLRRRCDALASTAAAKMLAQLFDADAASFACCSPMPREELPSAEDSRTRDTAVVATSTATRNVPSDFLLCCTQTHYTALKNFVAAVAIPTRRLIAAAAVEDAGWSGKRLAYVLRCVTAGGVALKTGEEDRGEHAQRFSRSGGGGTIQALLARLAAADVTVQRLSHLLMETMTLMSVEAVAAAPTGECADALVGAPTVIPCEDRIHTHLCAVANLFSQAAALLDECTGWWNMLHLESVAPGAAHSGDVLCRDVSSLLLHRSLLHHVRQEKTRLTDALLDVYAVAWWDDVVPQLEKCCPASLLRSWANADVRTAHLYVSLCLLHHHHSTQSGATAVTRQGDVVRMSERLQQSLLRYTTATLKRAQRGRENGADVLYSATVDMESLLNDEPQEESHHNAAWQVEEALLRLLVQQSSHVVAGSTGENGAHKSAVCFSVEVTAAHVEERFAAALKAVSSPPHAALLWRTLALVLDSAPPALQLRNAHVLSVSQPLWKLVADLSGATPNAEDSSSGAIGLGVESVMALSLLSSAPCVVEGVVMGRLLRRRLTSKREEGDKGDAQVSWLERLVAYGMDETGEAGAESAATFERNDAESAQHRSASYFNVTVAPLAMTFAAPTHLSSPSAAAAAAAAQTPATTVPLPLSPALCRRAVPTLVAAVLRDASLVSEKAAGGSLSREDTLLRLVHSLGYTAPQAWPVALHWIRSTPYPLSASVSRTRATENCTLLRLRAAFTACGPWPPSVARPLLAYAVQHQSCAQTESSRACASCGAEGANKESVSDNGFPEAAEFYALHSSVAATVAEGRAGSAVYSVDSDASYHPLISPLCLARAEEVPTAERPASSAVRTAVAYRAYLQEPLTLQSKATSRAVRFRVTASTLPSHNTALAAGPRLKEASTCDTEHRGAAAASFPLSALQLASEEQTTATSAVVSPLLAWQVWMQRFACATSLQACVRLLHEAPLAQTSVLPRRLVVPTLRRMWKVMLMRRVEVLAFSSAAPHHELQDKLNSTATDRRREEDFSAEQRAWLEACAAAYVIVSTAAQGHTGEATHPRTARQLNRLAEEVCRFWAAALLEHVLIHGEASDAVVSNRRETTASRLRALMKLYAADSSSDASSLTSRGDMQVHLNRALKAQSTNSTVKASERLAIYAKAREELNRAVEVLLDCRHATAGGAAAAAETKEEDNRTLRWTLWPPAAWELWRIAEAWRDAPAQGSLWEVRNPLLAVAAVQAWQHHQHSRSHVQSADQGNAGNGESPLPLYTAFMDMHGAAGDSITATGQQTLMQLWRFVDACVQRDGRGCAAVIGAFLRALSAEDTRVRQQHQQQQRWKRKAGSAADADADAMVLKAVLRRVRSALLPTEGDVPAAGTQPLPGNPWSSYLPLCFSSRRGNFLTDPSSSSPWGTFLHVLHLCTSGVLDRSAERRGRRAAPSALAAACVAHRLEMLRHLHGASGAGIDGEAHAAKIRGRAHHSLAPRGPPLAVLSRSDGERVLCWQLRQLQHIRSHVNALGWTVEQQQQYQEAQRHVQASAACVAALLHEAEGEGVRSALEVATAACFYPHLAALLTTAASSSHADAHAQRGEVDGEKVMTDFADGTTPRRRKHAARDSTGASALLQGVHQLLLRNSLSGADASLASRDKQLEGDYALVHAYLAAVLGGVAQRQRSGTAQTLLAFLTGDETARVLRAVACGPEDVARSLGRIVSHLLRCLLSPPQSSLSAADEVTAVARRTRVAEAGVRLCLALQPWLPVNPYADNSGGVLFATVSRLTDASLAFAVAAMEGTQLCKSMDSSTDITFALVGCVVHDVVVRQQSEVLSQHSVALLGVVQQQLAAQGKSPRQQREGDTAKPQRHQRYQRRSLAVEDDAVLWRVLRGLAALDEREAAEVHQAWQRYSIWGRSERTEGEKQNLHSAVVAEASESSPSPELITASLDVRRRGDEAAVVPSPAPATDTVTSLYRDAVRLLYDTSCTTPSSMSAAGFEAASRLRRWWAADRSEVVDVAQLHVLEDLLCLYLASFSIHRVELGDDAPVPRAVHQACRSTYARYLTLRAACGSNEPCSLAAVVALQLGVAAHLLTHSAAGSENNFSDGQLLDVLRAVIDYAESASKVWLFALSKVEKEESSSAATAFVFTAPVEPLEDVARIADHLLHVMRQQTQYASQPASLVSSPALTSLPLLRDWESIMTPLRALRLASTAQTNVSKTQLQLVCSPRGVRLQEHKKPKMQREGGTHRTHRPELLTPAIFYVTLRALLCTGHLLRVPLHTLLSEVLLPLLVLEEGERSTAAEEHGSTQQRQIVNRVALLGAVARQLPTHEALRRSTNAAARLAVDTAAATRLTVLSTGAAGAPQDAAFQADLQGWPAALVVLKVLTRLEAALHPRRSSFCTVSEGEKVSAASVFASHYAALLARRNDSLHDFLAFVLVARRHAADEGQSSALAWPSVLRVITVAASPSKIAATVAHFRMTDSSHNALLPRVATETAKAVAPVRSAGRVVSPVVVVAAVNEPEARALWRLCELLEPSS